MDQLLCQNCRTPLKLDESLEDLNPASFKILADAAPILKPEAPGPPSTAAAKERLQHYHNVTDGSEVLPDRPSKTQDRRSVSSADMSFVILSEPTSKDKLSRTTSTPKKDTQRDLETAFSEQSESRLRLFEVLSARSDIDHPICIECTDLLLKSLQIRQTNTIRERDAYVQFLKQAQEDIPTEEEKLQTHQRLQDVERREKEALMELEALELEKAKMEDELAALHAESEQLDEEEEAFWQDRNAFTAEITAYKQERDSLQNQLAHDSKLLEALQRSNVYNDTFCIGYDGSFGNINGLRLGKLPDQPVDWSEINAAWGQALLLLAVVSEKIGYTFVGWKLHPMGSTSRIEKIESIRSPTSSQPKQKAAMLDLFSNGDVPLSFGLLHRSFDSGMVAFLDCVRQLNEEVGRTSKTSKEPPYKVVKDTIGGLSIKLGSFGQEVEWTKACKYTLTLCKYLLAYASSLDNQTQSKPA